MQKAVLSLVCFFWIGCIHRAHSEIQRIHREHQGPQRLSDTTPGGRIVSRGFTAFADSILWDWMLERITSLKNLAELLLAFNKAAGFSPMSSAIIVNPAHDASYPGVAAPFSPHAPARRVDLSMKTLSSIQALHKPLTRRAAMAATAAMLSPLALGAAAATEEEAIEVYFGCGCFWHVQHEFVAAERRILKRNDLELTALSGYAGGKIGTRWGKVCYQNNLRLSEYSALGHAEVVRLRIPPSAFSQFALEYFALFDDKGNRPDQIGDVGLAYRNVVGIPGGKASPLAGELLEASRASGNKIDFATGLGSDPDLVAKAFIMDSKEFPFYQAEVYHQFHDGFKLDEDYPDSYNELTYKLLKAGRVVDQGCPNNMGVGMRADA